MIYFIAGFLVGVILSGCAVAYIGGKEMEKREERRRQALNRWNRRR